MSNSETPSGWSLASFEDAFTPVSDEGRRVAQSDYLEIGAIPIVDQGERLVGGYTDDPSLRVNSELPVLVFGDHTRRTKYVDFPFAVGAQGTKLLRATDAFLPKFLYYLLPTLDLPDKGYSRHYQYLRKLQFVMPPRPEQDRIVAELEALSTELDAAVLALKRVQANLKRYRASVLKAACEGRLVPTEAELAREEGRTYETGEQLLARILKERRAKWEADQLAKMVAAGKPPSNDDWKTKYKEPTPLDTSNLLELPEGWSRGTWQQLSTRVTVGHVGPMKDEYVTEGIPFLRSQNVRPNRFDPKGLLFIPLEFDSRLEKSRLRGGDLVVVRSGSVGTTCVVPDSLGGCNCADLVIIQGPSGVVAAFGGYYMNSNAKRLIESGKVGVALIHFNTQSVASLPVPVPPLDEQRRIAAETARHLSITDEVESEVDVQLRRATRLRQAILKRAFEGKLVPQDPNDEPASVLLERIRAERESRTKLAGEWRGSRKTMKRLEAVETK